MVLTLATVADLGSDPNSARQSFICQQDIPELGSDPKSAGHRYGACRCSAATA